MFLTRKPDEGVLVTVTSRVPAHLKEQLKARAAQSGCKPSAAIAQLLQVVLDLEQELEPFRPAIERLMQEEQLSLPQAIARLLWMNVEQNPDGAPPT